MEFFLQSLSGLLVVVGPWKAAIVFAERTSGMSERTRRLTSLYTVGLAAVIGLVFILVGEPLIEFFHISEAAFLIGAGLIVVVFSIGMIISEPDHRPSQPPDDPEGSAFSLAIFPLSVPLVITPAGIASLVALGVVAELSEENLAAVVGAFLVVMLVNLLVFLLESRYAHHINPGFYDVAGRVLGVLLVAFGVSLGIDGLKELEVLK